MRYMEKYRRNAEMRHSKEGSWRHEIMHKDIGGYSQTSLGCRETHRNTQKTL